ncbi:MAG TPA: DinB family protein [Verrucomicrobiae bacterium]|nr:DinB family protein [Verrucomicrobiae bacterium]
MSKTQDQSLLLALLDSWDRNNTILVNLLRILPKDSLRARATPDSPTVIEMFNHIHYVRLIFISEDAPELSPPLPVTWTEEDDRDRVAQMLEESGRAVRDIVRNRIETGKDMQLHYDHPILFVQHMIWHEGYHHGQVKVALKVMGVPIANEQAGPVTWRVWMDKAKLVDDGSKGL